MPDITDLIAQGPRPPQVEDPTTAAARGISLANALQGRQLQQQQLQAAQMENQQRAQDLHDQQVIRQSYMDANGDLDQAQQLAMKAGASPKAVIGLQTQKLAMKEQLAKLDDQTLKNDQARHDQLRGELQSFLAKPDAEKTAQWGTWLQSHVQNGRLTPQEGQQLAQQFPQYPGDDQMKLYANGLATGSQLMKEEAENRTAAARELTAKTQKEVADREAPGKAADAAMKQRTDAAEQLATATDAATYAAKWGELPAKVARQFPAPEQFDPVKTPVMVRRLGMTPEQQQQADQAAANQSETARHNKVEEGQGQQRNNIAGGELNLKTKQFNATFGAGLDANGHPLPPEEAKRIAMQDPAAVAIANYQMAPPQATLRGGATNPVIAKVMAINPQFRGDQFETAKKTQEAFTSGPEAKSINAINTVAGHLSVLSQAADALDNSNVPALNKIANFLGVQTGSDAPTVYKTIAHKVGEEMTKAYVGAGGGEGDRGTNASDFDVNLGAKQIKGNIGISAKLLQGKINGLKNQYETAIPGRKFDGFISPEAQQTFQQLGGGSAPAPAANNGAAPQFKKGDTVMYQGKPHKVADIVNGKLVLEN